MVLYVSTDHHRQSCTEGLLAASLRVAAGPAAPGVTHVEMQLIADADAGRRFGFFDDGELAHGDDEHERHSVIHRCAKNVDWNSNTVDGEVVVEFQAAIGDVEPWTAETPRLYTALFVLRSHGLDGDGGGGEEFQRCSYHAVKVGFRRVSVSPRDGALLLNGRPLKLRGVNRHEFNAWKGIGAFSAFPTSATSASSLSSTPAAEVVDDNSKREAIRDVQMMKRANFNAIRTSHYPNDPFFYLLCDHLGVYVVDEANIETHGLWDHFSDDPT